jgi:hypothetical protein
MAVRPDVAECREMSPPAKLVTGKKARAVLHVASGLTNDDVAAQVKVSSRTVQRWRQCPDFIGELRAVRERLRSEGSERTLDVINRMLPLTAGVLGRLLQSQNERIRLGAVAALRDWYLGLFTQNVQNVAIEELRTKVGEMQRSQRREARLDSTRNGYHP